MKRCGKCNQTYGDDMMFCLSDGTPLGMMIDDVEQQTVVRPSIATVVTPVAATAPASGSGAKYFAAGTAFLLLFGFLILVAAAIIFWPRGTAPSNANVANLAVSASPTPMRTIDPPSNTDRADLKEREDELERERKKLADERKKLEDERRKNADDQTPDPPTPPRFNDPGTERISFRRGSVGATVSGTVGRQRSYVLRTGFGQYLSADVSSAGGCVVFSGGSASTGFTTGRGDTRLTVINNCNQPANYRMSVTVR